MTKIIEFDIQAREKMKKGIDTLANAVKVTLGPKGRNVVIGSLFGKPSITKDGITVARNVELEDAVENTGAQMVKEVASKTADIAGDGTTTATVLAQAIISEGLKMVAAGSNPMDLKRGIDKAVAKVVENLKEQSKPVGTDQNEIEHVASISANNDAEIGKLIAEAMKKVGKEGVITVEEARGTDTTITIVEGMEFDRGFISPHFVTSTEKMQGELVNPFVLIIDNKVETMAPILEILNRVAEMQKSLLIIAEDVEGEALSGLVINKLRGIVKVAAVKSPGFGEHRKEFLKDIAVLTGGVVASAEQGHDMSNISMDFLGSANTVLIDKDKTTIINGNGEKEDIDARINEIKIRINETNSDFDKQKLQARLAKLSGGVAVLNIGAVTEVEMKEKKDRIDDALHATRAAVEEGIVAGGGVAYVRSISSLNDLKGLNEDEDLGINIIRKSLEAPLRQIVKNAGLEDSIIIDKVKSFEENSFGFNARTEKYENLIETGVIDPTKVSRVAIEHAASVAGLFLTTECIIVEKPRPPQQIPNIGMSY